MANPCANGGGGTVAATTDTPCLNHALVLHGQYIDLVESWEGMKRTFPGEEPGLYLHGIASQVLAMSEKYDWGGDDEKYEDLPSSSDLRDTLNADFESIESEKKAFDKFRQGLIERLDTVLSTDTLQNELELKPYHERIRLTADLLDRLDLYERGQELVTKLLKNAPIFGIDQCLDAVTYANSDEYLNIDGTFKLGNADSSDATAKAIGGSIDYLKAVSTTLLSNFTQQGDLSEFMKGIGHLANRFKPSLGDPLINNPSAQRLAAVRAEFDEQFLQSIRGQMGPALGNVLLVADQLAAIIKLVTLFLDKRGGLDAETILTAASEVAKILTGLYELAHQVTRRTVSGGAELLIRRISGIANLAGAVVGMLDAKDAWDQGDYSVMGGYALTALGGLALVYLDYAVVAGLHASALGPAGIAIGLVILIGTLIVIYTADNAIENWFQTSVFGTAWARDEDNFMDPEELQFRWKHGSRINYMRQTADLIAMLRGLTVAPTVAVGSSGHLRSFWSGIDIELTVARNQLGTSEADEDAYQYSVLELGTPGFEDGTWVFLKRVRKVGNDWQIEPIYCVDVAEADVYSLHNSTTNALTSAREYPNQTDPNGEKLGIWLAAKNLTDVYGLTKAQIDADVYLEFDVAILPEGATVNDAAKLAADLENQPVARKRTYLEVQ